MPYRDATLELPRFRFDDEDATSPSPIAPTSFTPEPPPTRRSAELPPADDTVRDLTSYAARVDALPPPPRPPTRIDPPHDTPTAAPVVAPRPHRPPSISDVFVKAR